MMDLRRSLFAAGIIASSFVSVAAHAAVSLTLVSSFAKPNGAFGLAYDGSNIWYSNSAGTIYQMTTAGVDTGKSITGNYWSALAFNSATNRLATMQSGVLKQFDLANAANVAIGTLNPTTTAIPNGYGGLIDGLDIEGGRLWWSPDVDPVFNSALDGSSARTQFLGGAGGYSGVEYVTVGSQSYVIVVNDASNPRQLCIHNTDASLVGCTTLANSRYEDLGFDGRYLYAADYVGNRIDKIDLLVDGGSIFDPGAVPEPATWLMMITGFGMIGASMRRRSGALNAATA
jgi:PEP-CTERM motif